MLFVTADLHLGHQGMIKHGFRPMFSSVEEMDKVIIDNINVRIGRGDLLYILGDFSLGKKDEVAAQRAKINCPNVYLIRGNHDALSDQQYKEVGFIFKGDMCEVKQDGQKVILCHYAMRTWNGSHRGNFHLFGHSHGNLEDDPKLFSFDVGVDCHNFCPLSWDDIKYMMSQRKQAVAAPNHPALD